MDKENLACVGAQWNIIQSLNEWNFVICNNMDETGNHCKSERNQAREWRAVRPQTEMETKLFTSQKWRIEAWETDARETRAGSNSGGGFRTCTKYGLILCWVCINMPTDAILCICRNKGTQ